MATITGTRIRLGHQASNREVPIKGIAAPLPETGPLPAGAARALSLVLAGLALGRQRVIPAGST